MSKVNNYWGYPTGMGSNETIEREKIGEKEGLVELGMDNVKGKELRCKIVAIRKRRIKMERGKVFGGMRERERERGSRELV